MSNMVYSVWFMVPSVFRCGERDSQFCAQNYKKVFIYANSFAFFAGYGVKYLIVTRLVLVLALSWLCLGLITH